MISSSVFSYIHWMAQHLLSKTRAASVLLALWCKADKTWLSKDAFILWDSSTMRCQKGNWQVRPQVLQPSNSPGESTLVSRNAWWDSAAQHTQPECCCLVWKQCLVEHGGMGRDVETAALQIQLLWNCTQNPSLDQHSHHPLLRKQGFWAPALRSKPGLFLDLKYCHGKELLASLRKAFSSKPD